MVKEVLSFSIDHADEDGPSPPPFNVTAEYEFLNTTNQAITIRMAFPIPDDVCWAANSPYGRFVAYEGRNHFRILVEGHEIQYATETRAFQSGKYIPISASNSGREYTNLLREFGIDPESCPSEDRLSQAAKTKLMALQLLDRDTRNASWTVQRKHYWTQTFAPNKTTHIEIEYPAQMGYSDAYLSKGWDKSLLKASADFWKTELSDTCGGADLEKKVVSELSKDSYVQVAWIDFILVTANYWNGPIKDFVLKIEKPYPGVHVNFCWDGPIQESDTTHFVATAHDFFPKRDLHIGFFQVF